MAFLYKVLNLLLPTSVKDELIGDLYELQDVLHNRKYPRWKILIILIKIGVESAFVLHFTIFQNYLVAIASKIYLYFEEVVFSFGDFIFDNFSDRLIGYLANIILSTWKKIKAEKQIYIDTSIKLIINFILNISLLCLIIPIALFGLLISTILSPDNDKYKLLPRFADENMYRI